MGCDCLRFMTANVTVTTRADAINAAGAGNLIGPMPSTCTSASKGAHRYPITKLTMKKIRRRGTGSSSVVAKNTNDPHRAPMAAPESIPASTPARPAPNAPAASAAVLLGSAIGKLQRVALQRAGLADKPLPYGSAVRAKNEKAPTEVRALELVQVAGAYLGTGGFSILTAPGSVVRISLRIHLLAAPVTTFNLDDSQPSAISTREMTKIGETICHSATTRQAA